MNRKNASFTFLVTVLVSTLLMSCLVFAKDNKCGVDDGAVRRTKAEVQASCGVDDGAVRRTIEEVEGKCGVDDGAVRRSKDEVEGKCGVDDGAVRRTKEEMSMQNSTGLTKDQKFYVGVMTTLFVITIVLSLYIMFGKTKDYEPLDYEKKEDK